MTEKLGFMVRRMIEVCRSIDDWPEKLNFCRYSGSNTFEKQPETLNYQGRLDILLVKELGGAAGQGCASVYGNIGHERTTRKPASRLQ